MKIVVTGAAGFIASHLCEELTDHEVLGVDNVNDYYNQAQKQQNIQLIQAAGTKFKKADIREETTHELIKEFNPDVIVHLAAMAGVRYSIQEPALYADVNVKATQQLLQTAKDTQARFVFASSSSVYGARTNAPFKETDDVSKQVSPYAATKRAGELLCQVHHHLTQLPVTCLRFFTVYGERGRPDMAPYKFMQMIDNNQALTRYGDGTTKRSYTYVKDITKGIQAAINKPKGYEIYNLGTNETTQLNEFIQTIEEVMNQQATIKQLPQQPGDVPLTSADITKARNELNYQPTTKLKEGLTNQYNWYKSGI